ncbi:hypothetical protein OEA41_007305 [Lepraria neglecta]|uniref:Uncharacterized protein n=1 Tax=Lepraria neglecta TaxID=209136 RepID=A0AAD9ZCJ3_9LECA|nr:hypothetical protein OEA41_007305 [Lepraria neglecta]
METSSLGSLKNLKRIAPNESVTIKVTNIVKDRSLKGRFRDTSYPSNCVPFYLYGAPNDLKHRPHPRPGAKHPTTSNNVNLSLDKTPSPAALAKGAVLLVHGISEAAMQPFHVGPGEEHRVTVYEDAKDAGTLGQGIVDVDEKKLIGKGKLTLGEAKYVDSVQMNKDPFGLKEGDEKFKAWKKIFDQIGKELE